MTALHKATNFFSNQHQRILSGQKSLLIFSHTGNGCMGLAAFLRSWPNTLGKSQAIKSEHKWSKKKKGQLRGKHSDGQAMASTANRQDSFKSGLYKVLDHAHKAGHLTAFPGNTLSQTHSRKLDKGVGCPAEIMIIITKSVYYITKW